MDQVAIETRVRKLFVEVNRECHMNCVHCSTSAGPSLGAMLLPDLLSLFSQGLALGMQHVYFSGGEPFLYEHLPQAFSWLQRNNVKYSLYTCGAMRSSYEEIVHIPRELLREARTSTSLIFSLHGATDRTHDGITGITGSHRACLQSLEYARSLEIPVEIHCVAMSPNWFEIPHVARLCQELMVSQLSILRLVEQGRAAGRGLQLSRDEYAEFGRMVTGIRQQYPRLKVRIGSPWACIPDLGTVKCSAGFDKLLVSADGRVFPCEAFKFLGSKRPRFQTAGLETIWRHDSLLDDLRELRHYPLEACKGCTRSSVCEGGCPGQRLLSIGSMVSSPDPICAMK